MYEKHFSFRYKPFELLPNPDFLFLSGTHQKAITYLDYGIKEKIGFILLTGEIGSGKTTIIRNLIKTLSSSIKLSRVNNTKITSEQLIAMINEDFGLETEGKGKTRLLNELNAFLIEQYAKKYQPILLIDEAQNLSSELLEEVRLLSNLETDRAKLLQIILVGQPELKKTLMLPELLQLRQRINISYHIAPLTLDETAKYINHRLTIAGNADAIQLHDDILNIIFQFSRGIPRLINIICDFALLTAFVEGKKEVSVEIVREVTKDLESSDYWNEHQDTTTLRESETEGDAELLKTVGAISLRLFKLEEVVNNNLAEIVSVTNKIIHLENDIAKFGEIIRNMNMENLIDNVAKLEQMISNIVSSNRNYSHDAESLSYASSELLRCKKQIEELTDTVSHLNKKINNH